METSEHPEVLFPSEDEVKSYFPEDVWNAMSQYERNSYRNIFHNYNVMRSLDLKPEKPAFMTLYQKKVSKRKAAKSPCRRPIPAKKPRLKKETPVKKVKVQQQKKKSETFSSNYKWSCIKAHCVFSAVFKVYKRFYGSIKGHYLNKRKPVKVANKHLINKASVENCDKTIKNEIITKNGQSENGSSSKISEGSNDEKSLQALMDSQVKNDNKLRSVEIENMKVLSEKNTTVSVQDTALKNTEENKSSTSTKKEESLNPVNKTLPVTAAVPHTKPVCRSVQTMTVAEGCSPSNCGALVFVNAATSKKSAVPFPDPKPLTPQQRKRMEKINREKMKNRRSIMTQTAAENTSIEEAKLVSIFVPKNPKKKSTPATKSDPGEKKEEVPTNTDNHENKVLATIPDSDTTAAVSSLASSGSDEQQQTKTVATVTKPEVKETQDDDSSDDEFGFYALARQLEYERAKKASTVTDTKTGLGDSDLAVPGCSGLQSDTKKKRASSAKSNATETKKSTDDTDLAVPGSSNQNTNKRYPKRAVPVVNYQEAELLQDDEYLFCDFCDREYEGDCPEHGPHKYFPDTFTPIIGDKTRAVQTAPPILKVGKSKIPSAGSGVWTTLGLPPHVRFGPYQGEKTSEPDPLGYSWASSRRLRSTSCERLMVRTRRIPVSRSTSAGRWRGRRGWNLRK